MNCTNFPLLLAVVVVALCSCSPPLESECQQSADCPDELFCKLGQCTDLSHPTGDGMLATDDSDSQGRDAGVDGGVDATDSGPPHPCPDAVAAGTDNLVLNEFMANVPSGPEGDANQDGERHYHDDEFVELVNVSDETIDLTDVDIRNDDDVRFTFPEVCLDSMHAAVVFGGIEDDAEPPEGDGYRAFVSDTWFRYAMGGGRVVVNAADGHTIADITYDAHADGSLNLDVDLEGSEFIHHTDAAADDEALFSPGTCADGRPFTSGCGLDASGDDGETEKRAPQ